MMWYAHTLFDFFLFEGWEFRAWVSGQSTCWWIGCAGCPRTCSCLDVCTYWFDCAVLHACGCATFCVFLPLSSSPPRPPSSPLPFSMGVCMHYRSRPRGRTCSST